MKRILLVAAVGTVSALAQTPKPACDVSKEVKDADGHYFQLAAAILKAAIPGNPAFCDSYSRVVRMAVHSQRKGSTQAKPSAAPSAARARSEEAELRRDSALAAELDAIQKTPDPLARALHEATFYEEHDKLAARDWKIEEVRRIGGAP